MSASPRPNSQSFDDSLSQSQAVAKALRALQDKLDASEAENQRLQGRINCLEAERALHQQLRQQQQRIAELERLLEAAAGPQFRTELEKTLQQLRSSEAAQSDWEHEKKQLQAQVVSLKSELTESKE